MKECIVVLANSKFDALVAVSYNEQEMGLMHKDPPLPIMVFPYSTPRINKFWMKNTKQALDIVFCLNNKIISICNGNPYSTAIIGDDRLSDLVIELPAGTCISNNIKIGDSVSTKYNIDTLMQLLIAKTGISI